MGQGFSRMLQTVSPALITYGYFLRYGGSKLGYLVGYLVQRQSKNPNSPDNSIISSKVK
jgi:hypothetical protein